MEKRKKSDEISDAEMLQILKASMLADKQPAETLSKDRARTFVANTVAATGRQGKAHNHIIGYMLACAASVIAAVLIIGHRTTGGDPVTYADVTDGLCTEVMESGYAASDVFSREIVMIAPATDSCIVRLNDSQFEYLLRWDAAGSQSADIVVKDATGNIVVEEKDICADEYRIRIDNMLGTESLFWQLSVRYSDDTTAQKNGSFTIIK